MSDRLSVGQLYPGAALMGSRLSPVSPPAIGNSKPNFQELLDENVLKFSSHAKQRMSQRGIALQPEQLDKIAGAIDQAEAKGAKDSLVIYRNFAMIVHVPSRTVVTAMEGQGMSNNVFTQIDSAIVIS